MTRTKLRCSFCNKPATVFGSIRYCDDHKPAYIQNNVNIYFKREESVK